MGTHPHVRSSTPAISALRSFQGMSVMRPAPSPESSSAEHAPRCSMHPSAVSAWRGARWGEAWGAWVMCAHVSGGKQGSRRKCVGEQLGIPVHAACYMQSMTWQLKDCMESSVS